MKASVLVSLMFAACVLFGCGSNSTKVSAPDGTLGSSTVARPSASELNGRWVGTFATNTDDPASKAAEGLMQMFGKVDLEFLPGSSYRLSIMGMPMEGTYTLAGNAITMNPKTVLGKTKEQLAVIQKESKNFQMNPDEAFQTMSGTVSADRKEIRLKTPSQAGQAQQDQGQLVFKPHTEDTKARASTVKDAERHLVGSYAGEMKLPKEQTDQMSQGEKEMAQAMMKTLTIDLRQDNTFAMNLMMQFEGKWAVAGDTLTLTFSETGAPGQKPMRFQVQNGGRTLASLDDQAQGQVIFTRK